MSNQLVAEFKTFKLLEHLTSRAEKLFSSREGYISFISQMNYAHSKGLSLDDFASAIDILEKIEAANQFLLSARQAESKAKLNITTSTSTQTEEHKQHQSQIGTIIEHFILGKITNSVKQTVEAVGVIGSNIKTTFKEIKEHFTKTPVVTTGTIPAPIDDDDEKKKNQDPENPNNQTLQAEQIKNLGLFTSSSYYQRRKEETLERLEKYYLGKYPDEKKLIEELKTKNLSYYEYQKELAIIKFESKYSHVITAFVRGKITAEQFDQITSNKVTTATATPKTTNRTKTFDTNEIIDVGGVISTGGATSTKGTTTRDSDSAPINYNDLLVRAEKVFPTTQSYNDFIAQVDKAVKDGESLTSFDFALTTFETLKASENSPHYQDELARISQDPQFSTFTTIAENLSVPYAQPLFTATKEISEAIDDTATLGAETAIVATTPTGDTTEKIMSKVKATNKVVLNVDTNGIVSNPEALFNSDGIVGKANITTSKLEETKLTALQGKVEGAESEAEATAIVDSYNTGLSTNSISPVEMSETFIGNKDIGMTNDNPIAKETQGLAVDSYTASELEDDAEEAIKVYDEAIKKLKQEEESELSMGGSESAVGAGPSLEA